MASLEIAECPWGAAWLETAWKPSEESEGLCVQMYQVDWVGAIPSVASELPKGDCSGTKNCTGTTQFLKAPISATEQMYTSLQIHKQREGQ